MGKHVTYPNSRTRFATMTVRELIESLQKENPEAAVIATWEGICVPVSMASTEDREKMIKHYLSTTGIVLLDANEGFYVDESG